MAIAAAFSSRVLLVGLASVALTSAAWLMSNSAEGQTPPEKTTSETAAGSPDDLAFWNLGSPTTLPADQREAKTLEPTIAAPLVKFAKPNVLIVSIDGMRPDCMLRADMPNIRHLMDRGSFTLWARTTDIAITLPSHVSMLTGVTPEKHGINFNDDAPADIQILVPSIFDFAAKEGISSGLASGKRKFTLFTRTHDVDYSAISKTVTAPDAAVATWASEIITRDKPRLMFVHFPGADVAGHAVGWGTPKQIDSLTQIDRGLGVVLDAYRTVGMADNTYIIISADHGGTARSHGPNEMRSHFIPWIFTGPGVRENCDLTRFGRAFDVSTFDTFATASYILGIPVPADSDGKPVLAAFENFDMLMNTDAASWAPTTTSQKLVPKSAAAPKLSSTTAEPATQPASQPS